MQRRERREGKGERETESKRANEMAAEDTGTERERDANPDRRMIVPPAATGREEGRDGTLWQHNFGIFDHVSSSPARPSFLARSRVQITSLKSPNG